jgi:hypothetical protein
MMLLGTAMIIAPTEDGSSVPIARIVTGLFAIIMTFPTMVSIVKGYRLTVADAQVVARRIIDRKMSYASIASVEIVEVLARIGQTRTCLRFHFVDGTSYTFKNFNGSLNPERKSYQNVLRAKELIDQRIAELRNPVSGRVPPPPPLPPPPPSAPGSR